MYSVPDGCGGREGGINNNTSLIVEAGVPPASDTKRLKNAGQGFGWRNLSRTSNDQICSPLRCLM